MKDQGILLVHYPVFFRLHQLAHRMKIRPLQGSLTLGGMIHLIVAPYARVREFHDHLFTYIAGRGDVGDLLSLVLTSTRTLQLAGDRDRAQRSIEVLVDVLQSNPTTSPQDVYFFERDTGLLTWIWNSTGRMGPEVARRISEREDIGGPLREIGIETSDGFSLPEFGDGHGNPIQGILNGLGLAGNCVDPFSDPLLPSLPTQGSGGVKVKIDPVKKSAGFDLWPLESGRSGAPICPIPTGPGSKDPLVDPRSPPGGDPSLQTAEQLDKALNDVLGKPGPAPTKEEMDELLATPAPESNEPPPERTTVEEIDEMLGNTPNPMGDGDGPTGPAAMPVPDDIGGPTGPAYFPQIDGDTAGGPAGRFYAPLPNEGGVGSPKWRFFYPKPDDIGPGGPAGRSLIPAKSIRNALRRAIAGQRYFPKSGSVFLPKITEVWSRTGIGAELLGSKGKKAVGSATYVVRLGNGGSNRFR